MPKPRKCLGYIVNPRAVFPLEPCMRTPDSGAELCACCLAELPRQRALRAALRSDWPARVKRAVGAAALPDAKNREQRALEHLLAGLPHPSDLL